MSISAMKQALDLLETSWGCGDEDTLKYWNETAQVLRQAIAEAEKQEAVAWMWKDGTLTSDSDFADGTWTPLFAAPVHARPVVHAVRCTYPQCQATNGCVGACSKGQADLATVGEVGVWGDKREWVGLTDEDIYKVIEENIPPQLNTLFDMAKWVGGVIEAKLKEKNQ